jgi:hypothetical protein
MTTCVTCGHANEASSAFCENCGAALSSQVATDSAAVSKVEHVQTAGQTRAATPKRNSKKMVLGITTIFLAVVTSAGAYWYSVPPEASPETLAKALTEHFSAQSGDIDELICMPIRWFDHREHVRVNIQTENRRFHWLNLLALEGLYTQEPAPGVHAGFKLTDAGQKAVRNGRLCFADGIDSIQVKEFRESDKAAQPRWAMALFSFRYVNLAKWSQSDSANYITSNFFKKTDVGAARVLVIKGRQWVVSDDNNFNKSVVTSAKNDPQSHDHATSKNQAKSPSFFDKLKNLFSGAPSIVGKWAGDGGDLEFFEDKTVVLKTHGGSFAGEDSGTWVQLDDGRIKIEFTIMGMKAPPSFAELHGSNLHVTMDRNVQFDVRKVN